MSDHLALHLKTDRLIKWEELQLLPIKVATPSSTDWHIEFINNFDSRRSLIRSERMKSALLMVRAFAKNKTVADWKDLSSFQSVVLGSPSPKFRNQQAYAKNGLEHYGYHDSLPNLFINRILAYQNSTYSPIIRAVRSYLDVCFFHPFNDGNARAARLCFDLILSSNSIELRDARPIFAFERFAGQIEQYKDLVNLVNKLALKVV